jgi:hypothetical protein
MVAAKRWQEAGSVGERQVGGVRGRGAAWLAPVVPLHGPGVDPEVEVAFDEEALCAALLDPAPARSDRNAPCACGSGAKQKHCCAREPAWEGDRATWREAFSERGR